MTKPKIVENIEEIKAKQDKAINHIENKLNPHNVTKAQIGLGDVDNTKDTDKPVSTATKAELDKKIDKSEKGVVNGVASLGTDGKVPASQLDLSNVVVDTSSFAKIADLNAHKNDTNIHVTVAQKASWELATINLASHTDNNVKHITSVERTAWNKNATDLTTHSGNNTIHITSSERTAWNKNATDLTSHTRDTSMHLTSNDRADLNDAVSHKDNSSIHVSSADRTNWNGKQNSLRKPIIEPSSTASKFADSSNPITVMGESINGSTGLSWKTSLNLPSGQGGYITIITTASQTGEYIQEVYVIAGGDTLIVNATRFSYGSSWSGWEVSVRDSDLTNSVTSLVDSKIGKRSLAIGGSTSAGSPDSFTVGLSAIASGDETIAIGYNSKANTMKATAIGSGAVAGIAGNAYIGVSSTALGAQAQATASYSTAVGTKAVASNADEVVIGVSAYDINGGKTVRIYGNLMVAGSKNFEMPHPKPEKKYTHIIRHGAVESPTEGDTLYRYNVTAITDGEVASISLPDYFIHLNKNVDVWVNGRNHFGRGFGNIEGENLLVTCEKAGEYNVLIIGTRNDDAVKEWAIKGVEREIGESWNGETYVFEYDEISEISEIGEMM